MAKSIAERMATMENKVENINEKLDNHILEQRQDFKSLNEKLDQSFAGKWVERVTMGLLIFIIVTSLGIGIKYLTNK